MNEVNVSNGKINFSQRNNELHPFESCNTTSLTMATSYIPRLWDIFTQSPYYKKYEKLAQPEDRLHKFMLDNGLIYTNHYDLMRGYNLFMGKDIDFFSVSASFKDLVDDLLSGKPWVGSGTFPGYPQRKKEPLGHIICVVGLVYENDPYFPAQMIIDDPYGNTMNDWQGSGNDIKIPWDLFVEWMKPVKDDKTFWAHRFKDV
jgi:hypothetical protein